MDNQQSVVTYIECPYCGKKLKFLNATHLKRHGKTVSDVKSEFPNQSLASQSYRDKQRDDTRDRWEEDGYRDRVSATLKITQNREDIKEKIANGNRVKWSNEDYKRRVSKKIRDTQNRPDKKLHMSKLSSMALTCGTIGEIWKHVTYGDKVLCLRSSLELKTFNYLVELNIPFEYESIIYEYKIDGFSLFHVVDFYLPQYNLIIEVKPKYKFKEGFIKNHNEEYRKIIAKRDGGIALGYNYIFITEDNLDSKDSFYKAISKYM